MPRNSACSTWNKKVESCKLKVEDVRQGLVGESYFVLKFNMFHVEQLRDTWIRVPRTSGSPMNLVRWGEIPVSGAWVFERSSNRFIA